MLDEALVFAVVGGMACPQRDAEVSILYTRRTMR